VPRRSASVPNSRHRAVYPVVVVFGRPDDTATEQQVIENVQVRVEEADHTDIGEPAHAGHREGVRGILTINLRVVVGLDTLRNAATKLDVRIVDELAAPP